MTRFCILFLVVYLVIKCEYSAGNSIPTKYQNTNTKEIKIQRDLNENEISNKNVEDAEEDVIESDLVESDKTKLENDFPLSTANENKGEEKPCIPVGQFVSNNIYT